MSEHRADSIEQRLQEAGVTLPASRPPVANYVMVVRAGSLLFVSGHGPFVDGKVAYTGKLGAGITVDVGREAARTVAINMLGTLKAELGELGRITRWVKLVVMVNATAEFAQHHLVADGATDLLVEVFGDAGRPSRSAIGVPSLPLDFAVEIDAVVEVDGDGTAIAPRGE